MNHTNLPDFARAFEAHEARVRASYAQLSADLATLTTPAAPAKANKKSALYPTKAEGLREAMRTNRYTTRELADRFSTTLQYVRQIAKHEGFRLKRSPKGRPPTNRALYGKAVASSTNGSVRIRVPASFQRASRSAR
jgi:hypothetical protein